MIEKGMYRHYRNGQLYEVLGIAYNADNDVISEPLTKPYVLYRPTYDDSTWVPPLAQFNDELEHEGRTVRRFTKIEQEI